MDEFNDISQRSIYLKNRIENEINKLNQIYDKTINDLQNTYQKKYEQLLKQETELREKLQNEVTKTKESLENFLSEINNQIKMSERINKGIKKIKLEAEPIIKVLSYISKINTTKKDMNKLLTTIMSNISFKYDEKNNNIIYNEYIFNGICPPKLKCVNILEDSVSISWNFDNDKINYKNIDLNFIKYRVDGRKDNEQFKTMYEGNDKSCVIGDLIPDSNYEFKICSIYNVNLIGESKDTIKVKTLKKYLSNSKIIDSHSQSVTCLMILKDGRLASCSSDQSIKIFNKNYNVDINISDINSPVYYILEVEENIIMACLGNGKINVYKIISETKCEKIQIIDVVQGERVKKVIKLIEGNVASIANTRYLKIWNFYNQKYNCIANFTTNNSHALEDIIEVKKDEVVAQINSTDYLSFIDVKNQKEIYQLNVYGIRGNHINELYILNKNILYYGVNQNLLLIDIHSRQIIKKIDNLKFSINCSIIISENFVIAGDTDGKFRKCKINVNNMQVEFDSTFINAHNYSINYIIKGKEGELITASSDRLIKKWE